METGSHGRWEIAHQISFEIGIVGQVGAQKLHQIGILGIRQKHRKLWGSQALATCLALASLHALARWADYLVVIVPGGDATRHLINAEVLDALGPEGYLINVARGTVVDEHELVRALASGRIAGAGLDVFDKEPQVPAELMAMENVVLLPHVASATVETRDAMAQRVFDNLQSFFTTGQVVSAVTRQ